MHTLNDPRSLATVLAALRYWQRDGLLSAGDEQDIASDGGELKPLTATEIDELCEALNGQEPPTAIIEINGGMVSCVRTSAPMRVVVLDEDTEGGDEDRISNINGQDMYVHDYRLSDPAAPGRDGVDPEFAQDVLTQL